MPANAALPQIKSAVTTIIGANLAGLQTAYTQVPKTVEGVYPCHLLLGWKGKFRSLTLPGQAIGGSPSKTRVRVHQLLGVLLVGERGDSRGLGYLEDLAANWPDAIDAVYEAHGQLGGIVLRAEMTDYEFGPFTLPDTEHFGVFYTAEVTSNPSVNVGQ